MNPLAEEIVAAQYRLHETVGRALVEFTKTTGLTVTSIDYSVNRMLDANGRTREVRYSEFTSSISTGFISGG